MARKKNSKQAVNVANSSYANPITEWLRDALRDREAENDSGVSVTGKSALGYAPVWSCINKIAGHVGYLPVHLYERDARNPKKVRTLDSHVSYFAIAAEPNEFMTAQTFKETLTGDAILQGNGRAYIVRDGNSNASEFIPLPPDRTKTFLVKFEDNKYSKEGSTADVAGDYRGWEKWHVTKLSDGTSFYIPDYKVLHIPGLSYDGVQGYSVVELAKTSLGLGIAGEKAAARNFKNGARPSFMLKAPQGVLTKQEEAREFLKQFREEHEGAENEGKVGLLRAGIELQSIQHTAQQSQWNEQRMFQRQEVALLFAVEQILGDDSSVSYNSLEEKNRAYITNCLNRWLNKWEQELARKTLTLSQRRSMRVYYRFDDWELTRGTMQARFAAYQIGRQAEILSSNECREFEDMPPREGGDDYKNPAINPATQEPAKPATQQPAQSQSNAMKAAVRSRIEHLVNVERKRVEAIAETPSTYCNRIDRFYSGWAERFSAAVRELGGDSALAEEWIIDSKSKAIKASGFATAENLKEIVERETATWQARASSLIDSILEVCCA